MDCDGKALMRWEDDGGSASFSESMLPTYEASVGDASLGTAMLDSTQEDSPRRVRGVHPPSVEGM